MLVELKDTEELNVEYSKYSIKLHNTDAFSLVLILKGSRVKYVRAPRGYFVSVEYSCTSVKKCAY